MWKKDVRKVQAESNIDERIYLRKSGRPLHEQIKQSVREIDKTLKISQLKNNNSIDNFVKATTEWIYLISIIDIYDNKEGVVKKFLFVE